MANRNLVSYFRGDVDGICTEYSVRLVPTFQQHWPWEEFTLAGDSPFIVQYESQDTPFEPIRKSRASINVVANEYFMDMYGEDAHHTQVILTDETSNKIVWCGYLTNALMNMPQDNCYETFTLEAIDCLSSLEYFDYYAINGTKQIVSFQDILAEVIGECGQIENLYVDSTIKNSGGTVIHMDELFISEQNFFSSDTDEPWKMLEVLEELCRYCGYTAVQWENDIFLFDSQAHTTMQWAASSDTITNYPMQVSSGDFTTYSNEMPTIFKNCYVDGEKIKGNGSDISLKTVYNTVTVKDSFYEIDNFVPDIYEDDLLHNTTGEMWEFNKLNQVSPIQPTYINKRNNEKLDASASAKTFYQRQFIHDWYSPVYRNKTTMNVVTVPDLVWDTTLLNLIKNDNGQVTGIKYGVRVYNKTEETKENVTVTITSLSFSDSETHDIDSYSYADYYLEMYHPNEGWLANPTYTIGEYGPYDIPDDTTKTYTRDYIGGTIVDAATITKANEDLYNYEIENSIDFDRYLLISQADKPDDYHANPRVTALTANELNSYFPKIFELNSGWTKPIIIDDKCYLTINGAAIFERYTNRDYIDPDWTPDCTGIAGDFNVYAWNAFTGEKEVHTCPPCLVFKLRIGDYYWNGSEWTTTDRPFYVDLHTPTDDDGFIDFSAWWGEEHEVINNVSWTDWGGVSGYKIPLTGVTFDWNQDIQFEVCLPNKIQVYIGNKTHNGMNSYCWVKDLKVEFATKGSENYDLADVVYENEINEYSVNTLSDITLKFTTYPKEGQHSYSNVGYNGQLLEECIKTGLDDVANLMEENIIKKYVNQFSTNTIEQTMTLGLRAMPVSRVKDSLLNKYFHVVGQEIDYARGRQTVTLQESKEYNE